VPRSHPFTAHVPSLTNKEGILYDVVGVGNALVDMIAMVDDAFLASNDMVKGSMALIETERAVHLSTAVGSSTRTLQALAEMSHSLARLPTTNSVMFLLQI
jgi:hypothetical protein